MHRSVQQLERFTGQELVFSTISAVKRRVDGSTESIDALTFFELECVEYYFNKHINIE